jgi:hypothetical protein
MRHQLQKRDYDFQLVAPFGHLNLIGARYTAILYHNNSEAEVISILRRSTDFMFDGRQVSVVPIKDMIQLVRRNGKKMLPKGDFDRLQ